MTGSMKLVKTAGRKYRLYNEDGKPVGDFDSMRDAKLRMQKRSEFLKHGKSKKGKQKSRKTN